MENNEQPCSNYNYILVVMLIILIPLDTWFKHLHQSYYKIPVLIINVTFIIYLIVFMFFVIKSYKDWKMIRKTSNLLKVVVFLIGIYFMFFRLPLGFTYSYSMVEKIEVSEKTNDEFIVQKEVEQRYKLYNSLKYSKKALDYDNGFSDGLTGEYLITITYEDGRFDDFYYMSKEDGFVTAITNYKILHFYNDKIYEILKEEGIGVQNE